MILKTANQLYKSLGTFWTQLFNEKGTVRGLSIAQAEESIQQYMSLIDTVKAYSVAECPIFNTTKWLPLIIKKSEFNKAPFVFETGGAVFGSQPDTDKFYAGTTFQFGKPKTPIKNVFVYAPSITLGKIGVIANRVLSPSFACNNGTEFYLTNNQLFFNFNIFDSGYFPTSEVIGVNGIPEMYVDSDGVTQQELLTVLWCYCADVDNNTLFDTYGRIFNVERTSSESYKQLLQHLMYMHTDGPTVENISAVVLAYSGQTPIQEQQEIIEDVFNDAHNHIVVTDKHVYKLPLRVTLKTLNVGDVLLSGDSLSTTVQYADNLTLPNWWRQYIKPSIHIGENVLIGNYISQLSFENSIQPLVLDSSNVLHFPTTGTAQDVATFHSNLDTAAIISHFGLTPGSIQLINPVDFLFTNFFKNNTALLKLDVTLTEEDVGIFDAFNTISPLLPPHVWMLTAFTAIQANDSFGFTPNNTNSVVGIPADMEFMDGALFVGMDGVQMKWMAQDATTITTNADGSTDSNLLSSIADYKDISTLFVMGKGGPQFQLYNILESVETKELSMCNNTTTPSRLRVNGCTITSSYPPGYSTREVRQISLLTGT